MDSVFLLDGKVYNVEVEKDSLERSFAVTDTEQSGRTLDYAMDRDIIGTFYNYTMQHHTCPGWPVEPLCHQELGKCPPA